VEFSVPEGDRANAGILKKSSFLVHDEYESLLE